jgi:uncharacterized protein YxeA
MKGQVFVISSILILLALFLIRASTKTVDVKQNELFYESFSNLKTELIKTVDIALINQESVSTRLDDFIDFSQEVYNKKGYKESINYTVSPGITTIVYLNVSLSSSDSYLMESLIINRTVYT